MVEYILHGLGALIVIGATLAPPALTILAYREWANRLGKELHSLGSRSRPWPSAQFGRKT